MILLVLNDLNLVIWIVLVKFDLVSVILGNFNQLKIYSFVSLCCDAFPKIQGKTQEQGT